MKTIDKILLAILVLVSFQTLKAQDSDTTRKNAFAIVPQTLFMHGIRIDIEHRLKKSYQWLWFSPQIYMDNKSTDLNQSAEDRDYTKMWGLGLDIYHKAFVSKTANNWGIYAAYGLNYQFFAMKFDDVLIQKTNTDGSITSERKNFSKDINKIGFSGVIGIRNEIYSNIFVDVYAGVGMRYSFANLDTVGNQYKDRYWNYGYSGVLLVAGLRLGVLL